MTPYELTNDQRKYFGLSLVSDNWEKIELNDSITFYYHGDRIVKILKYELGYFEYDTEIETKHRQFILPKTAKGKEQILTIPRILKQKGSAIQFSGSFQGGGIHVYDNRRNVFFIKSFAEDGNIQNYNDIDKWVSNYITNVPIEYFTWLHKELSQKLSRVKIKEGDIIAFKINREEYGFARILVDVFLQRQKGDIVYPHLYWFHPRSLIVAPYAYYSENLQIDLDKLVNKKVLPTLCIFDNDVFYGEMPVIGHRPLSLKDRQIPFPEQASTFITIPYTKTDIQTFIATNGTENI